MDDVLLWVVRQQQRAKGDRVTPHQQGGDGWGWGGGWGGVMVVSKMKDPGQWTGRIA